MSGVRVVSAQVDELELPLVTPFRTSFGVERRRRFLLLELTDSAGVVGRAECVAAREPLYSAESVETARWALREHLVPWVLQRDAATPDGFTRAASTWKGNRMAKACLEMALWDLRARAEGTSLASLVGGRRASIEVGVSLGIEATVGKLLDRVRTAVEEGYRRVKLKVQPGWDAGPVRAVRREFPDLHLWVDANQAYPPSQVAAIARWATRFDVEQVEQPFDEREIRTHARLRQLGRFRVCLDESITGMPSLRDALGARALSSLNVKPGRVGGHGTSLAVARLARRNQVRCWVGGMLETGVGRSHNVALASSSLFTLPGDLSASGRYYAEELAEPAFRLQAGGRLRVPRGVGSGVEVVERVRRRALRRRWVTRR